MKMDGRLIFSLSLFGLAMGLGTVFLIPSTVEPLCWGAIFAICSFLIGKRAPGWFFLHGFLVSLVNCVWITGAHVILFESYIARHPQEAKMMASMPLPDSPRLMMLMTGAVIGIVSGLVLGLLSLLSAKILRRAKSA